MPAKLKHIKCCRNDAKKYLDKTRIAFRDQLLVLQDLGNAIPITVVNDILHGPSTQDKKWFKQLKKNLTKHMQF